MPDSFDAIVVGSGLGGLTAGALFARTGAKVLLLERNTSFGGAATTFRHDALSVEASLHETTPPNAPGGFNRKVFQALDLETDIEFLMAENFQEIRCPLIGDPLILPHGLDLVEARLSERFPNQSKEIHSFLRQVWRSLKAIEYFGGEHNRLWQMAHAAELPLDLWAVFRDLRSSLSEVLARYFGDDEAIKFALAGNLPYFTDDPDSFWWLGFLVVQGGFLRGGGAFIKGGSQTLSNRLAEIIREEGGETWSGCEVVAIELGSEGEVEGVRYRAVPDGRETAAYAPLVFANAAPHVIGECLPAEHRESFMEPFRDRPLSISFFSITLGLSEPPSTFGISSYSTQLIPTWMERLSDFKRSAKLLNEMPAGQMPALGIVDYSRIDSELAKSGLFPLNIVCTDRLENWQGLSEDTYRQKKDAWLKAITSRLDEEWPGIADAVVDRTVATARTLHDNLNTPGGVVYGFAQHPPKHLSKEMRPEFKTTIKGLWLASSFAGFGGFAGAISCGAGAVRAAMRQLRRDPD